MSRSRVAAFLLVLLSLTMQIVCVHAAESDINSANSFISLGADLTDAERQIVLGFFNLDEVDLSNYNVITITNQEEHEYLDAHLDKGLIGNRALSSVMVTTREKGYGIHVITQNISYCTVGMYQNALATAGIKDADIMVVGPFSISGTAGLLGAIRSYEGLTGQAMDSEQIEAANQELAVSSRLGQVLDDPVRAEQLISIIKDKVIDNDYSQEKVGEIIDQTAAEMQISLTEEDRQRILELMDQVDKLDLNMEDIKLQISDLYAQLQNVTLHVEEEQAKGFLNRLWERFESFVMNLF
ncbi:MAG: DUF1002 domain-containing protein [Lachnospiraceae bacterium]|nr:DUF1002 domain-containing protein [Lachnospiraceae bacterium]MCI9546942.1 DUF1002 domain-containing protein [Lachnospiraceae bacterium]